MLRTGDVMPMMVVDDEAFIKEVLKLSLKESKEFKILDKEEPINEPKIIEPKIITSLDLLGTRGSVIDINRGRGAQRVEVPESLRALISEEAIKGTSPEVLSREFGVSKSSISAYKNDATSTASYNSPDKNLKDANELVREDVTSQARTKLLLALKHVTEEKMQDAKLTEIASVANSMSGIIKNMEPQGATTQNNTQIIVYKPRQREEDEFEIITVNE